MRLALGYGAFAIAAACFGWDYKFGFESTKYYTAAAVATYALLNAFLTFWMSSVEKGTVYQGKAPSGEKVSFSPKEATREICCGRGSQSADLSWNTFKITIRTMTKKNDPTYYLTVVCEGKSGAPQEIKVSRSFAKWFDETGRFVVKPFQEFLASSVPAIGKQDPNKARSVAQEFVNANPELLDAMMAASGPADEGGSTSTETAEKKGKRRKN